MGFKAGKGGRKKIAVSLAALTAAIGCAAVLPLTASAAEKGFDQYGYNRTARVFNGTGNSWCQNAYHTTEAACEGIMGEYSSDRLVMKWNKAWDECNENGYDNPTYCAGATLTNEWNGKVPGGSGEVAHYKFIWVGSAGESSTYWREGGALIWGNYEVLMEQGVNDEGHWVGAFAKPNGFGPKH